MDPSKYALTLMDVLFTDDEMRQSVYRSSSRSSKPGLDVNRIKLLEGNTNGMCLVTCKYSELHNSCLYKSVNRRAWTPFYNTESIVGCG